MTAEPLTDRAARDRIEKNNDATLFVNAGAGSGKTSALLDRIVTLVLRDGVPLHAIAAVTFTEKAGAELRDRLRTRLEAAQRQRRAEGLDVGIVDEALDDLDAAAIGTLHSFAQRILTEHPIEAGLPPLLEVLDEVGSSVAFEDRWAGLQTELLDDDEIAEALLLGMACGVQLKHIRSLAHLLGSDWDLIEERVLAGDEQPVTPAGLDDLAREAARIGARAAECLDESDRLLPKVRALAEHADLLEAAADTDSRLDLLRVVALMRFSFGKAANWPDKPGLLAECNGLVAQAKAAVAEVLDGSLRALTRWTGRRVLAAAQERRAEGSLEFHDLLVLARDLLRRNADVRAALHDRYQRLLLDEFQDTDPIQIELAVRIAGGAAADAADWRSVEVPVGRLFVVGDPKQSIYRFRRASISTYLDAESRLGETVSLTTNFRSVAPVLDWVNTVFGELIQYKEGGQPAYEPLDHHRGTPPSGPAVTVMGAEPHTDLPRAAASILREREARDVAEAVQRALREGWQVYDEGVGAWRPAGHDDIAILVPARTSLPFLEDALDAAGVPYRAEASSLVYQAAEVRSLLAGARAIADASDGLSLVTALRSPLFGCGDDDLWRWRNAGGYFSLYSRLKADGDPLADGPVGSALAYLRRLSFEARWMTPSEVLGAIVADRRMLEVAGTGPRERDGWRRLRFVVDQARAWSEVSHGGLRGYLAWAAHQGQETTRVAEAVLPETDADAVKVMTIHAAKGLEFPIVILSGLTSAPYNPGGVRLLWTSDGFAVKFGKDVETDDFETAYPLDEQMDELEKRRLLYVAATRARDHLVVSLHRDANWNRAPTAAMLLTDAGAVTADVAQMPAAPVDEDSGTTTARADVYGVAPPPDWRAWLAELTEIRASARRPAAISASGLEGTEPEIVLAAPAVEAVREEAAVGHEAAAAEAAVPQEAAVAEEEVSREAVEGAAKGPRDVELPPWTKGRYGSAIGRAVHGVLQSIDLGTGVGLDNAVASQCLAEGVADQADLVRALVQSALDSDVVQRAAVREHWRETYVGTVEADGTVLEGFVDLAYREDDGTLVIVDYKTDAIPVGALDSRVAYYRPQLDAYVAAHRDAIDAPVTATLLFLAPGRAVQPQPSI